jgi:hypothetical protein
VRIDDVVDDYDLSAVDHDGDPRCDAGLCAHAASRDGGCTVELRPIASPLRYGR